MIHHRADASSTQEPAKDRLAASLAKPSDTSEARRIEGFAIAETSMKDFKTHKLHLCMANVPR